MGNQRTIKKEAKVSGVGLHTGEKVNLTFHPAPPDHGYRFQRSDMDGKPIIKADVDYVVDSSRGTTLEHKGVRIATVEHVLAALVGLQIDNVLIEMDAVEVPIMDGSSSVFVETLLEAGIEDQGVERDYFPLEENIYYTEPERGVEIVAMPSEEYQLTAMIDYNSPVLGSQHASFETIDQFKDEVASARTFCFLHELEMLVDNDLIKGGDLNNAIVVVDKAIDEVELEKLAKLFNRKDIKVQDEGILNNVELRHANEPARHKLLDVVGDLALIGTPIKAKVIATKPGHAANIGFAKKVKKYIKDRKQKMDIPVYDPTKEPVYDLTQIQQLLPHAHPFLLVDKIIELTDRICVGIKNVTFNEPYFQGHFPGNPVMPGVLQIEALAQAGGCLVLSNLPDPKNYSTYFLKIQNARFKLKVVPGDTLILKAELLGPVRRGICEMKGTVFVGDKIACEAELVAQIAKTEKN